MNSKPRRPAAWRTLQRDEETKTLSWTDDETDRKQSERHHQEKKQEERQGSKKRVRKEQTKSLTVSKKEKQDKGRVEKTERERKRKAWRLDSGWTPTASICLAWAQKSLVFHPRAPGGMLFRLHGLLWKTVLCGKVDMEGTGEEEATWEGRRARNKREEGGKEKKVEEQTRRREG